MDEKNNQPTQFKILQMDSGTERFLGYAKAQCNRLLAAGVKAFQRKWTLDGVTVSVRGMESPVGPMVKLWLSGRASLSYFYKGFIASPFDCRQLAIINRNPPTLIGVGGSSDVTGPSSVQTTIELYVDGELVESYSGSASYSSNPPEEGGTTAVFSNTCGPVGALAFTIDTGYQANGSRSNALPPYGYNNVTISPIPGFGEAAQAACDEITGGRKTLVMMQDGEVLASNPITSPTLGRYFGLHEKGNYPYTTKWSGGEYVQLFDSDEVATLSEADELHFTVPSDVCYTSATLVTPFYPGADALSYGPPGFALWSFIEEEIYALGKAPYTVADVWGVSYRGVRYFELTGSYTPLPDIGDGESTLENLYDTFDGSVLNGTITRKDDIITVDIERSSVLDLLDFTDANVAFADDKTYYNAAPQPLRANYKVGFFNYDNGGRGLVDDLGEDEVYTFTHNTGYSIGLLRFSGTRYAAISTRTQVFSAITPNPQPFHMSLFCESTQLIGTATDNRSVLVRAYDFAWNAPASAQILNDTGYVVRYGYGAEVDEWTAEGDQDYEDAILEFAGYRGGDPAAQWIRDWDIGRSAALTRERARSKSCSDTIQNQLMAGELPPVVRAAMREYHLTTSEATMKELMTAETEASSEDESTEDEPPGSNVLHTNEVTLSYPKTEVIDGKEKTTVVTEVVVGTRRDQLAPNGFNRTYTFTNWLDIEDASGFTEYNTPVYPTFGNPTSGEKPSYPKFAGQNGIPLCQIQNGTFVKMYKHGTNSTYADTFDANGMDYEPPVQVTSDNRTYSYPEIYTQYRRDVPRVVNDGYNYQGVGWLDATFADGEKIDIYPLTVHHGKLGDLGLFPVGGDLADVYPLTLRCAMKATFKYEYVSGDWVFVKSTRFDGGQNSNGTYRSLAITLPFLDGGGMNMMFRSNAPEASLWVDLIEVYKSQKPVSDPIYRALRAQK